MNARTVLVTALALVGLVLLPSAAAATFDLGASKIVETALDPGQDAVFEMPLTVNQDGFLYGKVLPTPGNAVNDGSRANGSLVDGSGWSVTFQMRRATGELVEMGTYVDSTVSTLVPVANGDTPTLVMTVHVPADAARGGPQQKVYVAVAYRLSDGTNAGTNSGGVIDEARALTLVLSNALLPPAESGTGAGGATDGAEGPAEGEGAGEGDAPTRTPDESSAETPDEGGSSDADPVQPIVDGRAVQVYVQALPSWFLVGVLILGFALVAVLAAMTAAIIALARRDPPASREGETTARAVRVTTQEVSGIDVLSKKQE